MSALPTWQEVEARWDREAFLAGWAQAACEEAQARREGGGWGAEEVAAALERYGADGSVDLSRGAFEAGRLAGIGAAVGR